MDAMDGMPPCIVHAYASVHIMRLRMGACNAGMHACIYVRNAGMHACACVRGGVYACIHAWVNECMHACMYVRACEMSMGTCVYMRVILHACMIPDPEASGRARAGESSAVDVPPAASPARTRPIIIIILDAGVPGSDRRPAAAATSRRRGRQH
jgi:hypothetical protein